MNKGLHVTDGDRPALYTVGHSTHSLDDLLMLLKQHGVTAVADVRSHPYSARLGHFNREEFSAALEAAGIKYVFLGKELGARRDERESYAGDRAAYERIAMLPGFREGLERLRRGARDYHVALLCAEKEPLDCHRTVLVCRELRREFDIRHILADGSLENHADTERRLVQETGVTRTLFEPDLTEEDLVQQAYDERARKIAYRSDQEEATP